MNCTSSSRLRAAGAQADRGVTAALSRGRLKSVGGCRQIKFRGFDRAGNAFTLALAAYNLIRIPKLLAHAACHLPPRRSAIIARWHRATEELPPARSSRECLQQTPRPRLSVKSVAISAAC